jgi:chorismate mutase/prephenate dehydratase
MRPAPEDLAVLRREIDSIDDQLHDLLMRRGDVVAEIGRAKAADGQVTFRPAREAQLLRRLFARHRGALPARSVLRIWREIIAASIRMQGLITVGCGPIEGHGTGLRLAGEHFGLDTPVVRFDKASQVISAVERGEVSVGLLPLPQDSDSPGWWADIRDKSDLHAVARLPWFAPEGAGASVGALVVARGAPEESGEDRSMLMFSCATPVSRARVGDACAAEGLTLVSQAVTEDAHERDRMLHIVEVEGFMGAEDSRIRNVAAALEASSTRLLGAFARPASGPDTAGDE